MTKRRKTIAVALSILVLVLVFLVAANRYISDSFTLVAYEEGQPITDPSLNVPEDARLTEAYSSKGHIREHDSRGDLIQSDFVFWLPVTVNAIKAPKQVTYRVLDDDMGFHCPMEVRVRILLFQVKTQRAICRRGSMLQHMNNRMDITLKFLT